MAPRSAPVARVAAVLAVIVAILVIARGAGGPRWRTLRPGAEFAIFRGDRWCKAGPAEIAALRLDPARVRLRVRHYTLMPAARPLNIVEWIDGTRALAVFNAGQYYEDLSYMGLLVCDGRVVSRALHPGFKAALVAAPDSGGPAARVLDLTEVPLDPAHPGWREVAQSFMLFDHTGAVRIRRSDRIANRTVVGEDRHGRLVVVTSEGAYTLSDFAALLMSLPLDLSHAMCMDGGYEAELCVRAGAFRYASFGHWSGDGEGADSPGATTPLPAVVTVIAP
ncbi:MAG TPA: phosphodiester glycosidase family protein [Candidatus Eisenbacteria bacterium]